MFFSVKVSPEVLEAMAFLVQMDHQDHRELPVFLDSLDSPEDQEDQVPKELLACEGLPEILETLDPEEQMDFLDHKVGLDRQAQLDQMEALEILVALEDLVPRVSVVAQGQMAALVVLVTPDLLERKVQLDPQVIKGSIYCNNYVLCLFI